MLSWHLAHWDLKYGWQSATRAQGVRTVAAGGHSGIAFSSPAQVASHPGNTRQNKPPSWYKWGTVLPGKVTPQISKYAYEFPKPTRLIAKGPPHQPALGVLT